MPNLAWTYTTLLAALQSWPVKDSASYQAELPTIIGLGERRIWRDLNIEELDKDDAALSTTANVRAMAKPADNIQVRTASLISNSELVYLEKRSREFCDLYAPNTGNTGVPKYFAELSSSEIYLVPTPSQAYPMRYRYIGAPTEKLSSADPAGTTWLARAVPDALFAACLMEAEHYLKADDRYADMRSKYQQELVPVARLELRNSMRTGDAGPLRKGE